MLYRRLSALPRGEGAALGEAWNELRAVFEYAVAKMLEGDLRAFERTPIRPKAVTGM